MGIRQTAIRTLAICAITMATAAGLAAPASATTYDVTYDCKASTPAGAQYGTQTHTVDISAPATVAPGAAFDIVIDAAPLTIPSEFNGYRIKEIRNIKLKAPIPANSTYVSAELSGGSNLGPTPPTISVSDGVATVSVAGPIPGGSTIEFPTVTVHLTAGQSGTIETRLYGTSYSDPGLTFTAVVRQLWDINVPTSCFPNPSPVFTTTTIG